MAKNHENQLENITKDIQGKGKLLSNLEHEFKQLQESVDAYFENTKNKIDSQMERNSHKLNSNP